MKNTAQTHREMYPQQYEHPLVGKRVRVGVVDTEGTVTRVVCTRFGRLAILDGKADKAYLASACIVLGD